MMNRKAIVALIGNSIYIDPSDVERIDLDKVKAKAEETLKTAVNIVVQPIKEWMPQSGTEALMNQAASKLLSSSNTHERWYGGTIQNRHERRKYKKIWRK